MKYKNCQTSFTSFSFLSFSPLFYFIEKKDNKQFERTFNNNPTLLKAFCISTTITMSTSTASIETAFQPLHQGSISNANTRVITSSMASEETAAARPNLPAHMLRRNLLSSYVKLLCMLLYISMFTNPALARILLRQLITSCLPAVKNCKLTSTNTSPSKY